MSRFVRASTVLLLTGSLIVSCTDQQGGNDARTTIVFWHSFVATTIPALNDLVAEFEKDLPDVKVNAQYIPTGDALIQKLVAAVQSNTAPDVAWVHSDFLDKLVEADAIYPMRKFVHGDSGLSKEEMDDIVEASLEACRWKGELYALPMEATSLALFYNRELFRQSGLDPDAPPRTWDDLRSYAIRMTKDTDRDGITDQYGFFVPVFPASGPLNIWMNLQWAPFLWQAGGRELSDDGRFALYAGPEGVSALNLWKQLYTDLDFGTFGLTHDLGFASGKIAMILDGPWDLPRFRELRDLDWHIAPLPAGPAGSATYIAGEQLVIFRQSRHPAKTWRFVKWVLEPETQARFSMNSGYLPVRYSTLNLPEYKEFLQKDSVMRVFVEQMAVGRGRRLPDYHRVEANRYLAEAIENAIVGKKDVRSELLRAARRYDKVMRDAPPAETPDK